MQELIKLIAENPDLPIVALVNGEVCWDDCGYWMASFSSAEVADVGLVDERYYDDRDSFKEAYYNKYDEKLTERFNYRPCLSLDNNRWGETTPEEIRANEVAETRLEAYLEAMADKYMKKCIVVYIDEPDLSDWEMA